MSVGNNEKIQNEIKHIITKNSKNFNFDDPSKAKKIQELFSKYMNRSKEQV
jgi:hypothetical protein